MSNNNEQNGRQPPLPRHSAQSLDPRIRTVTLAEQPSQQNNICRDFVWGICTKAAQCRYKHVLEFESMKSILKFCHDHQNRPGCIRPNCTYLHTSKDEEDLFFATGQMPRVLAERHAAMSSVNMAPDIPPLMYEYMNQPPPPPPAAHLMMSSSAPPPPPPLPASLLALPPPPPPPTIAPTPVRASAPLYTAPPPPHNPSAVPLIIDTSRPPPPVENIVGNKNGTLKRPLEPCEAGPSKARKPEGSIVVDSLCENCVQRELRIEVYRQKMQKLECEKVCQTYILEENSDAYDIGKLLLKSVVSPALFRILEKYIEGSTHEVQLRGVLAQLIQTPSFVSSTSSVPHQFLPQFSDCDNYSNLHNLVDISSSSVSVEDSSILQSLISLARRANTLQTSGLPGVIEALRNAASSTERSESRTNDLIASAPARPSSSGIPGNGVNGLNHFLNGQTSDSTVSSTAGSPNSFASTSSVASAPAPVAYPNAGVTGTGPQGIATAPAQYLPYQPAGPPPPNRPYYPVSYGPPPNNMPSTPPYNNTPIRVSMAPQPPVRASVSAPPQNPQNYHPYGVGRYPSPYYPPYQ